MKLHELSSLLECEMHGDPEHEISQVGFKKPHKNSIVFIANKRNIPQQINKFGAVLTTLDIKKSLGLDNAIISNNPSLAFAKLTNIFKRTLSQPKTLDKDKNFKIGKNVSLGENPTIGCNVIIEDNVTIGNNVTISHHVTIHHGVKIGDNVVIGSGSVIGSEGFGNVLDSDNNWNHIAHLGSVLIGSNVRLGSNCSIDRGTIDDTIINSGVIIDNLVHIAHNVIIGENTAIAAKVGIAGSCNIGKRNMIGGMVGIIDHINTTDDVIISATSTVSKNIKEPGVYTGIMPISQHALWKRLAFWFTKLDKIVKHIKF